MASFDDKFAVHQDEMAREGTEESVVASGLQSREIERHGRLLAAANEFGLGDDAGITGGHVTRWACSLSGRCDGHVVGRRRQYPVVAHDIRWEHAHVSQRNRHFLASGTDTHLGEVELEQVVALDSLGTLLTPRGSAQHPACQCEAGKIRFHSIITPVPETRDFCGQNVSRTLLQR